MRPFLDDDFLLPNDVARELYHVHAKPLPHFDYHTHLPPDQIAENKVFRNLYEVWLAGDHYKWRAMRSNGIPERLITGDATDREKFEAYAATVPRALRNPLYIWTHLELKNYFGIHDLLDERTAPTVWDRANELLPSMPVHELLHRSRVAVVCTTDDPTDTLEHHQRIRKEGKLHTRVYPTFRPDKALTIDQPEGFNAWTDKLAAAANVDCATFDGFVTALENRHTYFHENGCRLSDHGLSYCYADDCTEADAKRIFDAARSRRTISRVEAEQFRSYLMHLFGEWDARRGWTKQLHLGALRNNNSRLMQAVGADAGVDSIGDWPQAESLSRYLDRLDRKNALPRTILYNVNPADNYVLGTMIGNFQDGSIPGKIQFGSGWWFLDQKEGMEWQINALSNLGLLSRFVGMLTDSRSFLSYSRHEYFRRILCSMLGRDVANGELPHDMNLLGDLVRKVCYENAAEYFGLETGY